MKIKLPHALVAVFLLTSIFSIAQTDKEKEAIKSRTNVAFLNEFASQTAIEQLKEKQQAINFAIAKNLPVRKTLEDGRLIEIQRLVNGSPIYYSTFNVAAGISTRANYLHDNGGLNLNIEGQNMTAHIWDGGVARPTHQEYDGVGGSNRFSIGDGSTTLNFHAAHVTGTIIASGFVANAKGMAPQATGVGYDWNNDLVEATNAAANGILLSNHSYGYGARDENGNPQLPAYFFGGYIQDSRDWDQLTFNAPYYLPVKAAGNDGQDDTANGSPLDGESGYDKLTGIATSKNVLVVANAEDAVINFNGSLSNVVINGSSSEGPTDDLRIKPDITGNGTQVFSSYDNADDAYNSISGTSMASPNVMGSLLLLQQYYNGLNGNFMRAATLKGLALHTADDAGPAGPDAIYGWGLMNAKKAAETIKNNSGTTLISELNLSANQTYSIDVTASELEDLQASISWTDAPGATTTVTNNNAARLVNDLDIRVTQNSNIFQPWKLTGVTTNAQADNDRDPFERVDVANPSGLYTITVTHKGTLTNNNINFSLVVTGIDTASTCTAEVPMNVFVSGVDDSSAYIKWDRVEGAGYEIRFRESGIANWTTQSTQDTEIILTSLNGGTLHEFQVRATCGTSSTSDYSNGINFTTDSDITYCDSFSADGRFEYISNVQLATINNDSGSSSYSDFTSLSTDLDKGSSHTVSVEVTWAQAVYQEAYRVWIDFNGNGDFNDSGELVLDQTIAVTNPGTTPATANFTVPNTALVGSTRMRVSVNDVAPATSCENFDYGEVEDYTINIIDSSCNNITDLSSQVTSSSSIRVDWTENNNPANTDWQVVAVFTGEEVPVVGNTNATTNSYTLNNLMPDTAYDIYVRTACSSTFESLLNIRTSESLCGSTLFDSGGISNYSNNESQTYTICPDNDGDKAVIHFNEFNLENNGTNCYDGLTIYDGEISPSNIIAPPSGGNAWCWDRNDETPSGSGDLKDVTIASSSGCLTLVFTSNQSVVRDGFAAQVNCESTVYLWDGNAWTNAPENNITTADNLYINEGNQAVINSTIDSKELYVDNNAVLILDSGDLNLMSNLKNAGAVSGSGTIVLNGTSPQDINGEGTLENLTAGNSAGVAINDPLALTGTLNITAGSLNTNNQLTFKSDASNTAVIGPLPAGASIIGNVTTENFIPAGNRSFRFLGSTVSGTTVFDSWQEAGRNDSGLGMQITGVIGTSGNNDAATGLDETISGNPSMFAWNSNTQSWNAITNTKNENLVPGNFYRVMIRGDRTTDLSTNTPTVTSTLLRATGELNTGTMTMNPSLNAGDYFTMANPYQSKLNMGIVTSSNVAADMYYWDPNAGPNGSYSTIDIINGTSTVGNSSNILQPGQAVFCQAMSSAASITMNETHKQVGTDNVNVFRSLNQRNLLKIKLFQTARLNNQQSESDGIHIHFSDSFNDAVDFNDASKLMGLNANIAINKAGNGLLEVERRTTPAVNETVQLHISNYIADSYTLAIELDQLLGMNVYVKDNFTNSTTLVNQGTLTLIDYTVDNNDPASISPDRFELIFQNTTLGNETVDDLESLITIYPNPVKNGLLSIETSLLEDIQYSINNLQGQLVKKGTTKKEINVDQLSTGVYLIKVAVNDQFVVKRFIIE